MVGASSQSLKDYLKKYTSTTDEEKKKTKRKKKVKPAASSGLMVVDENPIWQKPIKPDEEEEDSEGEDKPLVEEDIEVKRMKRLELLRSRRGVGMISEDGSGWVAVSEGSITKSLMSEDQATDLSPPRKRRARNDTPSPKIKQPHDIQSDDDLSPPRQRRKHDQSPSESKENTLHFRVRSARHDTPSPEPKTEASDFHRDLSPPRRRQRDNTTDGDLSPPRRGRRVDKDDSRASSPEDLSPPRKPKNDMPTPSISDLSPPRKRRKELPVSVHRPKTGLVTGGDMKDENDRKRKEDLFRFKEMDPSVSGRGAEAVYRNKITGERMSKEEYLKSKEKKKEEKPKEIKVEWGKGLAQKREAEARIQELEMEKNKPFARSRDDPDLDTMLKERVRWGDPMAHLVKKKNYEPFVPDFGDNEKMKQSGFIVPQEIPSHSWIKRGLEAAPNRYGIRPGRHWDGVDRSTGYEKELFKRMNETKASEQEAYQWSVADM